MIIRVEMHRRIFMLLATTVLGSIQLSVIAYLINLVLSMPEGLV